MTPRPRRVVADEAVHHVVNQLGRGERAVARADEAGTFVELAKRGEEMSSE